MKPSIYVDFDDVLSETARTLADIVAMRFQRKIAFEDIHSFDLCISFGLDPRQQEVLIQMFHDAEILESIPPVEGAAEGLRIWQDAGYAIHVVTGRPPETCQPSENWLKHHNIPYEAITFVDKYGRGHQTIPGVNQMSLTDLKSRQFDLIVDDSPDMAILFGKQTKQSVALFDRPWNQQLGSFEAQPNVMRCHNWQELIECLPIDKPNL